MTEAPRRQVGEPLPGEDPPLGPDEFVSCVVPPSGPRIDSTPAEGDED